MTPSCSPATSRASSTGARALGTDDPALLERAAAPLGVAYNVTKNGDTVEVGHSTSLYAIDDQGELVITWQAGVPIDDLAADMEQLLDEAGG
jgi:protein SCO1